MSLQDLGLNYPEGHPGECMHGMQDDGIDCIQCAADRAIGHISELDDIAKYIVENQRIEDDYGDIPVLLKSIRTFINKVSPEIESWKRVVTKLTHEKGIFESRCSYYETGLKLIVEKCINCPDTAQFADAMLDGSGQLHTDSVVSWNKDCDECHGMGFIKGWIGENSEEEIECPCPKCFKTPYKKEPF